MCESETLCISVYLFTVFVYLPSRVGHPHEVACERERGVDVMLTSTGKVWVL